jgi:hypothetical protein
VIQSILQSSNRDGHDMFKLLVLGRVEVPGTNKTDLVIFEEGEDEEHHMSKNCTRSSYLPPSIHGEQAVISIPSDLPLADSQQTIRGE